MQPLIYLCKHPTESSTLNCLKYIVFILSLLLFTTQNFAQEALQDFRVETIDGEVYVSWTLVAGFTCQGTDILRSTDSISFHEIGDIQGVCGSVDEPVSYLFIDKNPAKNQKNYYQLELGENSPSPILSVEYIDLGPDNIKVFPNPVKTQFSLAVQNRVSDDFLLEVFDVNGNLVHRAEFRKSLVVTHVDTWRSGIHILQITNLETDEVRVQRISIL